MKTAGKKFFLLFLFAMASKLGIAQNAIVVENISTKEFKKFQEGDKDISQSDIQKGDVLIKIAKELKPVKVTRVVNDKEKPNGLTKSKETETEFELFVLPKDAAYKDSEINLMITMGDNKKLPVRIITGGAVVDEGIINDKSAKKDGNLDPCKAALLKKKYFIFIKPAQMDFFSSKDPCGGEICDDCEPKENIVVYDFRANTVTEKFKNKKLKVGESYEFIVRHVNPYLFDVTISDTALNYNTNAEGTYLPLLAGPGEDATKIQSVETCKLNDTDLVRKAVVDLFSQLQKVHHLLTSMSPYTDASCIRKNLLLIRESIDEKLATEFGTSLGIASFNTLIIFMNEHVDIFKDATALQNEYNILSVPNFVFADKIPQVDNVDEVQFRFNILPKNKEGALPFVKNGVVRTYTKGGFKIDVSSGLYYGWLNNNKPDLRKDSVEITPGTFRRGNRIFQEKMGKGEFGFASFLHFYPRTGGFINVSGTIGAGVNFSDKPRPRYFAGLSVLAGRGESRIALNTGIMAGNTTRISDQYPKDASGVYIMLPENETQLITKQKFTSNFFVSVSYNLPFVLKSTKKPQVTTAPAVPTSGGAKPASGDSAKTTKTEERTVSQSFDATTKPAIQMLATPVMVNPGKMKKEKSKKKYN